MKKEPIQHIKDLAEPIVQQEDMFLVDVEIKQENMSVVWILVDSETEDVKVDRCSKISRELSYLIEEHEIFNTPYRLNVSSPGLSRPLSDLRQYKKNKGRKALVKYKTDEGFEKVEGTLSLISPERIVVEVAKGNDAEIPFEDIVEAKIVPKI